MMMKNYGEGVEIIHIQNWSYVPDYHYKILIIGDSVSGKTNLLLNLIKHQRADVNKIYLYVNDPFEPKYQLLIEEKK